MVISGTVHRMWGLGRAAAVSQCRITRETASRDSGCSLCREAVPSSRDVRCACASGESSAFAVLALRVVDVP